MEFAITALKRADDSYLISPLAGQQSREVPPAKVRGRGIMQQTATQSYPIQSAASSLLHKVSEVSRRFDIVTLNRQIEVSKNLLGKGEVEVSKDLPAKGKVIDVAILGQFKAGKSSFINSLIGEKVLPVGAIPVTTVITRLHYAKESGAVVTYVNGDKVEALINEVEQFISEEKNPGNEKNVAVVDVGHPAFALYPGLRFVDTPGLGSAFKYNTETSQEWLPEVGAAIVAISAERPLSENDLNLIKDLAQHTPKIILLLTKVDLLLPNQQQEVIRFSQNILKREINDEIPLYPYSTAQRTDSLRGPIDDLLLGLSRNRDAEFTNIVRHKIRSLVKSCLGYLDLALRASLKTDAERDDLKKLILTEKLNYDIIETELFLTARENMQKTRTLIASHLETKRERFTKKLVTQLKKEMPTWKGNLWRLTRRYEEWLQENLQRDLRDLSQKEHRQFFDTLNTTHLSISRSLNLFRNLLEKNIEGILGVKLPPPDWDLQVAEPTHPDIAFTKIFDFHFDLLWFLIPMFIFRGVFQRHFLRQVPSIVEIHLSRLAYQWEVRINKSIEKIRDQALRYVRDELSTVDKLLSRSAGRSKGITNTIQELRDSLEKLGAR
jgi:GTP-binding protein EngB required for normal cell division